MTYHDNNGPGPRERARMGNGLIAAVVVIAVLILGGLFYSMSGDRISSANRGTPTQSGTTGQSTSPVAPGSKQNVPNPTPPAR